MGSRNSIGICGNALILTFFAAAIAIATASTACAQQVIAFVNGEPVTALDIAHRAKFLQMSTKKVPTPKEVMDSLIDEILEVHEAKRFGLDVSDEDVNKAYAGVATRMGMDAQKLTQVLANGGASADTLKRRLKAQYAWASLVRGRYKASLEIRDSDVEAQLELHKSADKPDSATSTSCGRSSSSCRAARPTPPSRRANTRPTHCARASSIATKAFHSHGRSATSRCAIRSRSSPPISRRTARHSRQHPRRPPDPAGGDRAGLQMFALCDKKETKSDTPEMREIRDQIFQPKFDAKAKRFWRIAPPGDDRIQDMPKTNTQERDIVQPLALTLGEPAGDRARPCARRLVSPGRTRRAAFYVVGDADFLASRARSLGLEVPIAIVDAGASAPRFERACRWLPLELAVTAEPGRPDARSAPAAIASIRRAVADVMAGAAAAVVTNPVAKNVLYDSGFAEPGHTEFLATLVQEATGKSLRPTRPGCVGRGM